MYLSDVEHLNSIVDILSSFDQEGEGKCKVSIQDVLVQKLAHSTSNMLIADQFTTISGWNDPEQKASTKLFKDLKIDSLPKHFHVDDIGYLKCKLTKIVRHADKPGPFESYCSNQFCRTPLPPAKQIMCPHCGNSSTRFLLEGTFELECIEPSARNADMKYFVHLEHELFVSILQRNIKDVIVSGIEKYEEAENSALLSNKEISLQVVVKRVTDHECYLFALSDLRLNPLQICQEIASALKRLRQ